MPSTHYWLVSRKLLYIDEETLFKKKTKTLGNSSRYYISKAKHVATNISI